MGLCTYWQTFVHHQSSIGVWNRPINVHPARRQAVGGNRRRATADHFGIVSVTFGFNLGMHRLLESVLPVLLFSDVGGEGRPRVDPAPVQNKPV